MGIPQPPSGAFQVRFQHDHASYVATYPTRELAEEAEPLLRAAALAGRRAEAKTDHDAVEAPPLQVPTRGPGRAPTPAQVRASSAAAAELIDTILDDVVSEGVDRVPAPDVMLTTGQAAVLLGVSRPTLVGWLEAGRFPFHRRGTHRRVNRPDVLADRHQLQQPDSRQQI